LHPRYRVLLIAEIKSRIGLHTARTSGRLAEHPTGYGSPRDSAQRSRPMRYEAFRVKRP
jgi:hypothetical protein